jgi:thiol-disulfide isomerase/thioredoxin
MNTKLMIALGVALLALVLISMSGTVFRRLDGFQGSSSELLIVKAGWCGHCKTAMPEFQKLVKATPVTLKDGSSVTVRMLDEGVDKAEVQTLQVKGFPTILYRGPSGDRMEYSGPRTYDGVMGFLKNM